MTRLRYFGLLVAGLVVLTLGPWLPVAGVRWVVVLPAVLLVPGLALLAVMFAGRDTEIAVVPRLVVAGLLSTVFWVVVALLLHLADVRITRASILVTGDLIVSAALVAGAALAARNPSAATAPRGIELPAVLRRAAPPVLGVLAAVALLAVLVPRLPDSPPEPYDVLRVAEAAQAADGVIATKPDEQVRVPLTVENGSEETARYDVTGELDGAPWASLPVVVPGRTTSSFELFGAPPRDGCRHRLQVDLRRDGVAAALTSLALVLQGIRELPCPLVPATPPEPQIEILQLPSTSQAPDDEPTPDEPMPDALAHTE